MKIALRVTMGVALRPLCTFLKATIKIALRVTMKVALGLLLVDHHLFVVSVFRRHFDEDF